MSFRIPIRPLERVEQPINPAGERSEGRRLGRVRKPSFFGRKLAGQFVILRSVADRLSSPAPTRSPHDPAIVPRQLRFDPARRVTVEFIFVNMLDVFRSFREIESCRTYQTHNHILRFWGTFLKFCLTENAKRA
jgi:hypothetical protein